MSKPDDPRRAEATHMRQSGNTIRAIAAHFDVSPSTVVRWTNKPRKKAKPKPLPLVLDGFRGAFYGTEVGPNDG